MSRCLLHDSSFVVDETYLLKSTCTLNLLESQLSIVFLQLFSSCFLDNMWLIMRKAISLICSRRPRMEKLSIFSFCHKRKYQLFLYIVICNVYVRDIPTIALLVDLIKLNYKMAVFWKSCFTTRMYINVCNSVVTRFFLETFTNALSTHRANWMYQKLNIDKNCKWSVFSYPVTCSSQIVHLLIMRHFRKWACCWCHFGDLITPAPSEVTMTPAPTDMTIILLMNPVLSPLKKKSYWLVFSDMAPKMTPPNYPCWLLKQWHPVKQMQLALLPQLTLAGFVVFVGGTVRDLGRPFVAGTDGLERPLLLRDPLFCDRRYQQLIIYWLVYAIPLVFI